jgi:hypothetical protein
MAGNASASAGVNGGSPMGNGVSGGAKASLVVSGSPAPASKMVLGGARGTGGKANAATQGPDDAYLAKVMGSYDPNSKLDRSKADAIRQQWIASGGKLSPNDVYSNKNYIAASDRKKVASFVKGIRQSFGKTAESFIDGALGGIASSAVKPLRSMPPRENISGSVGSRNTREAVQSQYSGNIASPKRQSPIVKNEGAGMMRSLPGKRMPGPGAYDSMDGAAGVAHPIFLGNDSDVGYMQSPEATSSVGQWSKGINDVFKRDQASTLGTVNELNELANKVTKRQAIKSAPFTGSAQASAVKRIPSK